MDKAARDRWCRTVYPKLEREIPGLVGALTGRASAHTMRLALLYALLDKSEHIRLEHLEAAEGLCAALRRLSRLYSGFVAPRAVEDFRFS